MSTPSARAYPVSQPVVTEDDVEAVAEAVRSSLLSGEGPCVRELEERFSDLLGRKHAVALSSGSAALDVAYAALGLGEGDVVVVPTFCIVSCVAELARRGCVLRLVDCASGAADRGDAFNASTEAVVAAVRQEPVPRACLVTHTYHFCVDVPAVQAVCDELSIPLIEDAAEALGVAYEGPGAESDEGTDEALQGGHRLAGSCGTIAVLSLYANKAVTAGEGGMLVTDCDRLASRARALRNMCFAQGGDAAACGQRGAEEEQLALEARLGADPGRRFVHREVGWNYRMGNLQAALAVSHLDGLAPRSRRMRLVGSWYRRELCGCPHLQLPAAQLPGVLQPRHNGFWVFAITLSASCSASVTTVCKRLSASKVGNRPGFWPVHRQPCRPILQCVEGGEHSTFPNAELLAERAFYLPSGSWLDEEEVVEISRRVRLVMEAL